MWKIDRDNYTFTLISAFDRFVDDFFYWILDNQQSDVQILELKISRGGCRITDLAKKTKVKDYLVQFCINDEVNTVATLYYQYRDIYHTLPQTGITPSSKLISMNNYFSNSLKTKKHIY